jgi:predicted ATPase
MVINLARPMLFDNRPYWGQGEISHTQLDLKPLSRHSCRLLVNEILQKVNDLPDSLREQVVSNAEGNPFYVEELVKILIEDGLILKDELGEVWHIDSQLLPDFRIPTTLTAVLQARLDGLPEAERTALQQAAVVGRIFWDAVIQVLQESDQPPQPALSRLAQRELIYPREASAFAGTDEYIIKHALLRDVVYESVLKRLRRVYHRKTADWLVEATQSSGRGDEYAVVIGKHYEQAGENLTAAEWYIRAGEKAKRQGANQEAYQLLPHAIELLPATAKDLRWRALVGLSTVLSILGKTDSWRQNQATLMALAQESQDDHWLAEAYHREGYLLETIGNLNAAIQAYKASVNASERSGDSLKMADTLGLLSIALIRLGERSGAIARVEEALEIIQGREEEITTGRILTNISVTLNAAGDKMRSLLLQKQAVAICQRFQNQYGEAVGLSNIGYDYTMLGQPDQARSFLESSDKISETIGSDYQKAFNSLNLALAYWRNGEASQARTLLEKAIEQLGEMEEEFGRAAGHSYLGLVLESEEKYAQAEEQFGTGKEKFQTIQIQGCVYDAIAGQARCAWKLGKTIEALTLASELWNHLDRNGSKGMEFPILAYLTCAQIFAATGDNSRSGVAVQAGYEVLQKQAEDIGDPEWQGPFLNNIPEHQELIAWWQKAQDR